METTDEKNDLFANDLGSMNSDKLKQMDNKKLTQKQILFIGGIVAFIILILIILILVIVLSNTKTEQPETPETPEKPKNKIG